MDSYTLDLANGVNEKQHILFMSDLHCTSPSFNRKEFDKDIQWAISNCKNLSIFIGGDTAELIFPSDQKRWSAEHEKQVSAMFSYEVREAEEILKNYAPFIVWVGMGNHEASALKYNHDDFTLCLISNLQKYRGNLAPIHHGGYKSFIRVKLLNNGSVNGQASFVVMHFHGSGAGAPVTKGMISLARLRSDYEADIYWVGHKHTEITDRPFRVYMDRTGVLRRREIRAFFTAGYQMPFIQREYDELGYISNFSDTQESVTSSGCALLEVEVQNTGSLRVPRFRLTN